MIDWKIAAYQAGEDGTEPPPRPPGWPRPQGNLAQPDTLTAESPLIRSSYEHNDYRNSSLGPAAATVCRGVGTWALGGPFTFNGRDAGWGEVDDAESIRALHVAIDAGVTLIDTAPTYGTGHSELIVRQALAESVTVRESLAVATKFGLRIDEGRRTGGGTDVRPGG